MSCGTFLLFTDSYLSYSLYASLCLRLHSVSSVFQACTISSKYCGRCAYHLPLSSFLRDVLTDATDPTARVYATCIPCRATADRSRRKRSALQALDPNIQPAKRVRCSKTGPQGTTLCP